MAQLAAFLIGLAWPIVKKVLVSLGIGIISYAGLSVIYSQIQTAVLGAWGQLGGTTLQIASLGGIPDAIGIVLGGISARLTYMAAGRLGRVAGG